MVAITTTPSACLQFIVLPPIGLCYVKPSAQERAKVDVVASTNAPALKSPIWIVTASFSYRPPPDFVVLVLTYDSSISNRNSYVKIFYPLKNTAPFLCPVGGEESQ